MIRGLLAKTLRETWLAIVLFALALMLVERLLMFILPQIQQQTGDMLGSMPFAKTMLSALLGIDIGNELTARMLQSLLWVHPVVLSLIWGHSIIFCTRFPAGEIDRGTIDVLLGLPVSRRAAYCCESMVWVGSGAFILTVGTLGYLLGAAALPAQDRPTIVAVGLVVANLFCVNLAVGGLTYLVSAASNRRGRAIGVVFAMVVASFLLNFLAQFWTPAQSVAFMGVLNYYQPARILSNGEPPWRDIAALLAVAAVAWIAGGEILARRSICTT